MKIASIVCARPNFVKLATISVALARKVLCMLYHLLIHQEIYHDDLLEKPRKIKHLNEYSITSMSLDEMIKTIIKSGYGVRKNEYLDGG